MTRTITPERSHIARIVGPRVQAARLKAGLTQKQLGLRAGYAESSATVTVSTIENCKSCPSLEGLVAIAQVLGCKPGDFLDPDTDDGGALPSHVDGVDLDDLEEALDYDED